MTSKRQDFEMDAGNAKTITFTVTDGSDAIDLTSATIRWRMGKTPSGPATIQKTATTGEGISITDPTNGVCVVTIDAGDISDPGLYWHALDVTVSGGTLVTVTTGRVVVNPTPAAVS